MQNEAVRKFHDEHGDFVIDVKSSMLIFQDGARRENPTYGHGVMIEPPDDDWERAIIIKDYWNIKASIARNEFADFKDFIYGMGGRCPAELDSEDKQIKHLKKLRDRVRRMVRKYDKARKEVDDVTPAWWKAKQRERSERLAQQAARSQRASRIQL